MKIEQIIIDGVEPPKLVDKKDKRNWENKFQKWSDNSHQNETSNYGKCGYGYICDYCNDFDGRPCVRALNVALRETHKEIDYKNTAFEDVWNGNF